MVHAASVKSSLIGDGRVRIDRDGPLAIFTVVRPEVHNALDLDTINTFEQFITSLEKQSDIRVAIIAGDGDSFIAGGDLVEFSRLRGEEAGRALSARVQKLLRRLANLSQISIAAISGHAYGGGVELALACDLRVVESDARVGLTQGRFGLTTAWGGTARLVQLIGYSRALDLLLTRRILRGQEVFDLGLANRLVDDGDAVEVARKLGAEIANLDRALITSTKRLAQAARHQPESDIASDETAYFGQLWASKTHERLVQEFIDRDKKPSA